MRLQAERSYLWLIWSLALVGFALDQGSKYTVFYWLYNNGEGDKHELISGKFELETQFLGKQDLGEGLLSSLRTWGGDTLPYVNKGALGGIGKDANMIFTMVSIAAALAILAWSTRPATGRDRFLSLALGLILAGTLGNLYDRLVFGGVRDFLHWYYIVDWPVFNLADSCLVCGAFLLLVQAFCTRAATEAPREVASGLAGMAEVAEAK